MHNGRNGVVAEVGAKLRPQQKMGIIGVARSTQWRSLLIRWRHSRLRFTCTCMYARMYADEEQPRTVVTVSEHTGTFCDWCGLLCLTKDAQEVGQVDFTAALN